MVKITDRELIIVGTDILPHTSPSSTAFYAVSVYDASKKKEIGSYEKVNLQKLIGIVRSSQAAFIAIDNIYELVKNPSHIPHLCLQLLPNTKLVQITGAPLHGYTPLSKLMRENDLDFSGKLTPLVAAKACAILASKKLGYLVEPFEDETKIIVSRTRSKGPGGWSQKRYGRLMDTTVHQEAKKVESLLIEMRLDFDKNVVRSKFGSQKVTFNVYAPISEVTKVIKKQKGEICQISIHPITKERVEFIPFSQQVKTKSSLRRLIVGIDPGLTIGLSILDFNGKIIKIASYREVSRGQIIREISRYGKPSLVCVDVYPYPSYVEKIASTLNARLYTPRSVMTVSEKNEISRKLALQQGVLVRNAHQRDSLASAYKGYMKYKAEFERIDRKYFTEYDKSLRDEIKHLLIKGKTLTESVNEITKSLSKTKQVAKEHAEITYPKKVQNNYTVEALQKQIDTLQEQIDWERSKNNELQMEIRELEERVEYLVNKLQEGKTEYMEKIQREKTYIIKENQISFLKEKVRLLEEELERFADRIDELKRVVWLRNREGWIPLKVIKKFTMDEIEKTSKNHGLGPGDTVLILDTTGGGGQTAEKLLSYNIKAILGNVDQLSYYAKMKFVNSQLPTANVNPSDIIRIDEIAIIKEETLEQILKRAQIELDKTFAEKKKGFLDNLLEEYRKERKVEIAEYDEILQKSRKRKVLQSNKTDEDENED
ncbi:MAG: DUF460 domain-containing protein [Candidatus Heimdallarchaeaceae archaeon]